MIPSFRLDVLERALNTAWQAFAAVVIPSLTVSSFSDMSALKAVALAGISAGIGAGLSVLKSSVASKVGDKGTAALLPAPSTGLFLPTEEP